MATTERRREARIGTTFWVAKAIHTVHVINGQDRKGAWLVQDNLEQGHTVSYDKKKHAWVGVPIALPVS